MKNGGAEVLGSFKLNRKRVPRFYRVKQHEWNFGRARNAVETRANRRVIAVIGVELVVKYSFVSSERHKSYFTTLSTFFTQSELNFGWAAITEMASYWRETSSKRCNYDAQMY